MKVSAHAVKLADKESKQKETHGMKLADKESKRQEKDSQQKLIGNPSSATKPRSTKASVSIIRELRRIAAFQAQLFIFTEVNKTKALLRCTLIEDYFHGNKKSAFWGCAFSCLMAKARFALSIM